MSAEARRGSRLGAKKRWATQEDLTTGRALFEIESRAPTTDQQRNYRRKVTPATTEEFRCWRKDGGAELRWNYRRSHRRSRKKGATAKEKSLKKGRNFLELAIKRGQTKQAVTAT